MSLRERAELQSIEGVEQPPPFSFNGLDFRPKVLH